MRDDKTLERWFALEMARLRDALVTAPRSLAELVAEERPTARTRSGAEHAFDKGEISRAFEALSPLERRRVRLPATFYVDSEMPEDAYVTDEPAVSLLRALREVPPEAQMREGRLWLGHARARSIAQRHPTLFQFAQL